MKKLFFLLSVPFMVSGMLLSSCDGGKKLAPEDEVRNYGKNFVEKLSANQLDSLTASYPDLVNAESLVPVQSDTILVAETTPGQFDLTLAEGITLKVNRSDEGNITVTESKGLFTFPADKVDIAKKAGMIDDEMSDVNTAQLLQDTDFFSWLEKRIANEVNNALTVSAGTKNVKKRSTYDDLYDCVVTPYTTVQPFIVTNNSSSTISGDDYEVTYTYIIEREEAPEGTFHKSKKGITLAPGQSDKIVVTSDESVFYPPVIKNPKIKWKKKGNIDYQYTGNEYQEYLNSKK